MKLILQKETNEIGEVVFWVVLVQENSTDKYLASSEKYNKALSYFEEYESKIQDPSIEILKEVTIKNK